MLRYECCLVLRFMFVFDFVMRERFKHVVDH